MRTKLSNVLSTSGRPCQSSGRVRDARPPWLNSNIRRAPRPAPMDKCTIGPKRSTRLEATSRRQPSRGLFLKRRRGSSVHGPAALGDRDKVKQRQAGELAERAIARDDWVRGLGCPPADPATRELWMAAVSTVAAYRDRRTIGPLSPLGDNTGKSIEALAERRRLQVALNGALRLVAMPKTAQLTLSAETSCSDGICGEVDRVIIDPDTKAATHIVVEAKLGVLPAELVPMNLIEASTGEIRFCPLQHGGLENLAIACEEPPQTPLESQPWERQLITGLPDSTV